MKGRKPKPAEIADAQGNPGRRRVVRPAHETPALSLSPPKDLPAAAKRVWQALAPELIRMKLLRLTDVGAFSRYCEHLARWAELTKQLRKDGETYVTESAHGTMRRICPEFQVRDRLESRLEALEDRFGLTPSSRQQVLRQLSIVIPQQQGGDLLDRAAAPVENQAPPPAPVSSPIGLLTRGRLN